MEKKVIRKWSPREAETVWCCPWESWAGGARRARFWCCRSAASARGRGRRACRRARSSSWCQTSWCGWGTGPSAAAPGTFVRTRALNCTENGPKRIQSISQKKWTSILTWDFTVHRNMDYGHEDLRNFWGLTKHTGINGFWLPSTEKKPVFTPLKSQSRRSVWSYGTAWVPVTISNPNFNWMWHCYTWKWRCSKVTKGSQKCAWL